MYMSLSRTLLYTDDLEEVHDCAKYSWPLPIAITLSNTSIYTIIVYARRQFLNEMTK